MRLLALGIATAGGAGVVPIAPGTAGSAVGVLAWWLTRDWPLAWQVGLLAAVVAIGTWAATETARHYGREDPGQVVIDEVAGQMLTLLFTGVTWTGAILGFLLFRALDIVKPWPARRLEALHGGAGIMADDLMAAVYGNLLLHATLYVAPALR